MTVTLRPTPETASARERLTVLSSDDGPPASLRLELEAIARLPYVEQVLALPDLHHKANAEVPSSLAIVTRGMVVPEFTSVAINDGMGVLVTDLEAKDLSPEKLTAFFRAMNASAAAHPFARNRLSLSAADLSRAAYSGARAAIERYGLEPAVAEAMEGGGHVDVPGGDRSLSHIVPALLRLTPAGRCEMGLNFAGNHFLEAQVVDTVHDIATARRWGLASGRVVIMYHLGPGPFGGTLLHFYTRRKALAAARAPWFFMAKLGFHFERCRRDPRSAWAVHFRRNGMTPLDPDSADGLHFRQALAMATNVGFAYRVATIAAIRDALRETFHSPGPMRLVCDISHNSLGEERDGNGSVWVARHNACRAVAGRPALIAGAHDVPSYLAVALAGAPSGLHSYDHGAGQVIEAHRAHGRLAATRDATLRLTLGRGGRKAVRALELVPVKSASPIERVLDCYERRGALARVVRLRPLGTLKNPV
jgi:tRNA-splicing ligase RtcB